MEYRSLSLVAGLSALLAVSLSARAVESGASAGQEGDWQQRLEQAAVVQAEARTRQAAADRLFEQKDAECFSKFQVNACRDEARREHMSTLREARRLENQGKAQERQVKKEQLVEKDRRRAEAMPQHEADLAARQAETTASRQATAAEQAASQADKARKAEEGAQRKAAEAEKLRKKSADHEARVAGKIQNSKRPADDAEKK